MVDLMFAINPTNHKEDDKFYRVYPANPDQRKQHIFPTNYAIWILKIASKSL